MATRLDERSVATSRRATAAVDPLEAELQAELNRGPLAATAPLPSVDATRPRQVPTQALVRAMATWLVMVWALCWVALPLASVLLTGLSGGLLLSGILNAPVFAVTALIAMVATAVAQPSVVLSTRTPRDPVLSAFAGGLLSWAVIHNVLPFLLPFSQLSGLELAILVGINVIEMGLMAVMLANFTRSRTAAFGLGAGTQWLTAGLMVLYWA